jgi:hypothetical protein
MRWKLLVGLLTVALALVVGSGTAAAAPAQHGGRGGGRGLGGGGLVQATATVTGLTVAQVRAELAAGKSLAQVAQDNGKTTAEVIASARASYRTRLDQAVAAGRITQAQADAALQRFDTEAPARMTAAGGDCAPGTTARPTARSARVQA